MRMTGVACEVKQLGQAHTAWCNGWLSIYVCAGHLLVHRSCYVTLWDRKRVKTLTALRRDSSLSTASAALLPPPVCACERGDVPLTASPLDPETPESVLRSQHVPSCEQQLCWPADEKNAAPAGAANHSFHNARNDDQHMP